MVVILLCTTYLMFKFAVAVHDPKSIKIVYDFENNSLRLCESLIDGNTSYCLTIFLLFLVYNSSQSNKYFYML